MTELAHRRPQSVAEYAEVDYTKAIAYLGLNPASPQAHALVLVCKRYDLDPLLGHISIYDGKPYVHFVGYLHIANAHPQFAGIECLREWDDDTYFWATVRVHRGDRDFPAERTGKSRKVKRKKDGGTYTDDDADAKAFAQAARRALRMSFNIDHPDPAEDEGAGPTPAPAPVVEVARRVVEQTADPGPAAAPHRPAGSATNASAPDPGGNDATQAGRSDPSGVEASTSRRSPSSPGGRRDRTSRSEVPGGASAGTKSGETTASGEGPPAGPQRTSERRAANDATSSVKQAGSASAGEEDGADAADPSLLSEPPGWEQP